MNLPASLQLIVDRITARTKTALQWPATKKIKQAFTDNLTDLQALTVVVEGLLAAVPPPPPPPPPPPDPPPPPPPDPPPPPPLPPPPPSGGQLLKGQVGRRGWIRLSPVRVGVSTFERGGFTPGIAFNPAGNGGKGSLFVTGQDTDTNRGGPTVAEIDIPTPGPTRATAPVASFLQPFATFDEGVIDRDTPHEGGNPLPGWYWPITLGDIEVGPDGKLYATWYVNYDSNNNLKKFIFRRPLNLSELGKIEGGLGPAGQSMTQGGALGVIPPEWRARLLGKTMFSGGTGVSITSRCPQGPSFAGWHHEADWNINGDLRATMLQDYPYSEPAKWLASYTGQPGLIPGVPDVPWQDRPYWSGGVFFGHGHAIVGDSLLQFYTFGQSAWHYGIDPSDTASPGQGNHAPPYRSGLYVTDLHQLEEVAKGTRQPWRVVPHALWDITPLLLDAGENIGTGHPYMSMGLTHDPVGRRIFVKRPSGDPVAPDTAIIVVLGY